MEEPLFISESFTWATVECMRGVHVLLTVADLKGGVRGMRPPPSHTSYMQTHS